jgi:NAD(P)-dependent dehydrogenase (short-subunit alcohol dehydrogenase family)
MDRLAGRRAIVTGAARGIGQAVVTLFIREGARVAALDHRAMDAPPGGLSLKVDLRDTDAVNGTMGAAINGLGGLDILVNAAAALTHGARAENLALSAWDEAVAVNLTAPFLTCRAAIPAMRESGGGAIVNVGSVFGRRPAPDAVAYCATKGGLTQMTRALARDHAADGIRVNILSPGAVRTERLADLYGSLAAGDAALAPAHPVGRIADPNEIAEAALFLASDASGFVTGTDLLIDGGFSLR